MFKSRSTKINIEHLENKGDILIKPGKGALASGLNGEGRLEEPENIVKLIKAHVRLCCDDW